MSNNERAEIRVDLIRRLFAVAISVGFAATFTQMDWIISARRPTDLEFDQICILATGLILTVLSWDGYLLSVKTKPHIGIIRYSIDVILVFVYMIFLISSKNGQFWLHIVSIIFFLYVVWDFFTVVEHLPAYDSRVPPAQNSNAEFSQILNVYRGGLSDSPEVSKGPIITLGWAICFWALLAIKEATDVKNTPVFCIFSIIGLILYRWDKTFESKVTKQRGFPLIYRVCLIALVITSTAAFFDVIKFSQ